jgi:hypothetical protein
MTITIIIIFFKKKKNLCFTRDLGGKLKVCCGIVSGFAMGYAMFGTRKLNGL